MAPAKAPWLLGIPHRTKAWNLVPTVRRTLCNDRPKLVRLHAQLLWKSVHDIVLIAEQLFAL
jgi:hypothetical protein